MDVHLFMLLWSSIKGRVNPKTYHFWVNLRVEKTQGTLGQCSLEILPKNPYLNQSWNCDSSKLVIPDWTVGGSREGVHWIVYK